MVERNLQIRHDGDDTDAVLGRGNILRVGAVIESPQACYILNAVVPHVLLTTLILSWPNVKVGSNNIFGQG